MIEVQLKEITDRCRRMETRLTKFLEAQGFDTQVRRPVFLTSGEIQIPSISCSITECLSVVPPDWDAEKEIFVTHKGEAVMSLFMP